MGQFRDIRVRPVASIEEVAACVRMSLSKYSSEEKIIRVDPKAAMDNAMMMFSSGEMFIVATREDKIVAWLVAVTVPAAMHSREKCLTQAYYHSTLSGISAVRAMRVCHNAMISYASSRKIPLVKSGSYLSNSRVFMRILENDGWYVAGDTAVKRVPPGTAQEGPRLGIRRRAVAG